MFQKEIRVPWLWRLHFSGNKPELWKFYTQSSTEIYKSLVLLRKNIGFLTEMVNYGTYSLFSGRNFRKKRLYNNSSIPSDRFGIFRSMVSTPITRPARCSVPHTNSPDWSSYIPFKISGENLIKDQSIFSLVIILFILITISLDNVWLLLGENWCWSLLDVKGLSPIQIFIYLARATICSLLLLRGWIVFRTSSI